MNNGNKLKRRVQLIILLPIVLALGLLGATIYINGISSQMGVIAVALLILFIVAILIMYFTLLPELSSVLVDYSLEQGKIQKELLHDSICDP